MFVKNVNVKLEFWPLNEMLENEKLVIENTGNFENENLWPPC